jgi:cysteinyl-tRNA synthetase
VTLHVYDTRSGGVGRFEPLVPGSVGIYVCGPTVQAAPHVGHVRSQVVFDVLRRWLMASGYGVTFVRNVTDIEDKILDAAAEMGIPWWALAERNTRAFDAAYQAVGVLPPTGQPRATGHIPEMVALIRRLVDGGHAYASGGDVYFDVRSFPSYGSLSNQRLDAMIETERTDPTRPKRDLRDFALWKGAKPGEPSWDTPWGPGRPGWHVECSAMATKYLGPVFDIHGAGLDLVFPHNENEAAQSEAAGDGFARYWMHNGLVNMAGEKMSKSQGNVSPAADLLSQVAPPVLRYALLAPHYRSEMEVTADVLAEATASYGRLETFVRNAVDALGDPGRTDEGPSAAGVKEAEASFQAAMDDDLATPRALAVVHQAVRDGNLALTGDQRELGDWLAGVRRMLTPLGLDPVAQWPASAADLIPVVDALVRVALGAREEARSRRDYAAADVIRAELLSAGVVVEDTPDGARWHLAPR